MSEFTVRPATRDDCPGILTLIQELANFEHLPDAPQIGFEVLQRDGFDVEHPLFKCFVAELKDKEKIPANRNAEVRKMKVGSALFDSVVKVGYDAGCNEMDFMVANWNPAIEFYKRKGAEDLTVSEKWHRFRLRKNAIENICNKGQNNQSS